MRFLSKQVTSTNNGNVLSQTITVPSVTIGGTTHNGFTAVQNYNYDSLNRLKQATENITPNGGSQSLSWQQTFTFDRYGNRNFDEANTSTLPTGCMDGSTPVVCEADKKMLNPQLNPANNKMASGQDWSYDPAGNVIGDPNGRSFIYDALVVGALSIAVSKDPTFFMLKDVPVQHRRDGRGSGETELPTVRITSERLRCRR